MSVLKDPKVVEKIEAEKAKAETKGRKDAEKEFKAQLKEVQAEAKEKSKAFTQAIKDAAAKAKSEIEDKAVNKQVAEIFKELLASVKDI